MKKLKKLNDLFIYLLRLIAYPKWQHTPTNPYIDVESDLEYLEEKTFYQKLYKSILNNEKTKKHEKT